MELQNEYCLLLHKHQIESTDIGFVKEFEILIINALRNAGKPVENINESILEMVSKTQTKILGRLITLFDVLDLLNTNKEDRIYIANGSEIHQIPVGKLCDFTSNLLEEQTPETWEKISELINQKRNLKYKNMKRLDFYGNKLLFCTKEEFDKLTLEQMEGVDTAFRLDDSRYQYYYTKEGFVSVDVNFLYKNKDLSQASLCLNACFSFLKKLYENDLLGLYSKKRSYWRNGFCNWRKNNAHNRPKQS